jgi:hypothetical protein
LQGVIPSRSQDIEAEIELETAFFKNSMNNAINDLENLVSKEEEENNNVFHLVE